MLFNIKAEKNADFIFKEQHINTINTKSLRDINTPQAFISS